MVNRHASATRIPVLTRTATEIERREYREERSLHRLIAFVALCALVFWILVSLGVVRALTAFMHSKLFWQ